MYYRYKAIIKRVIDGDTFVAEIRTMGFNVTYTDKFRLLGIDTPETYRPKSEWERAHGKMATALVKELIEGKEVIINSKKSGKYGRWLAEVFVPTSYVSDNIGLESIVPLVFDEVPSFNLAELLTAKGLAKLDNYTGPVTMP